MTNFGEEWFSDVTIYSRNINGTEASKTKSEGYLENDERIGLTSQEANEERKNNKKTTTSV